MRHWRIRGLRKELQRAADAASVRSSDHQADALRLGRYDYFERREKGENFEKILRRPRDDATATREQVVVDPNAEGQGHALVSVGAVRISRDGSKVAFLKDISGEERHELIVRDIATQQLIPMPSLAGVVKGVEWDASGRYLFVATTHSHAEVLRASQCWLVDLEKQERTCIAEENDPEFMLEVATTSDDAFIRIGRLSLGASEHWMVPANEPSVPPLLMWPRTLNKSYGVDHVTSTDSWLIYCDSIIYSASHALGEWKEHFRVPSSCVVSNVELYSDQVVLVGYREAVPWAMRVSLTKDNAVEELVLPSVTRIELLDRNSPDKLEVSSPKMAPRVVSFSMERNRPSGDERIEVFKSPSGVPITYIPGHAVDSPLLLHVYGAYGAISPADFDPFLVPLLDRGWALAWAHVRGGGMLGLEWHQAGRGNRCIESSRNLNECARFLNRPRIALRASSAGVLTAAAAMHLPEAANLYRTALLEVGFLNPSAPELTSLRTFESDEWGDEEHIRAIDPVLTLSRVQHTLPSLFLTASDADVRVAKSSVARYAQLMAQHQPRVPVTLQLIQGGHFGDQGSLTWIHDAAEQLDFLIRKT